MKNIIPKRILLAIVLGSWFFFLVETKANEDNTGRNGQTARRQTKPNILLVMADDVGTGDVPGYWGSGLVDMPNLEEFVSDGVVFTDAHSTPLCAPSRYVLLSGNYQHRGLLYPGTWTLNYRSSQFRDNQQSIADVLKANGYHTAMMGKWHLGGQVPTQSWYDPGTTFYIDDESKILTNDKYDWSKPIGRGPQDLGFDSSYMTLGGIQGPPYTFVRDGFMQSITNITTWKKGTYDMPEGSSIIKKYGEGSPSWDSTAYNMILLNETERFLDDHIEHRNDDPFFAYIALGNVHIPHSPPRSFLDGAPIAGEYPSPHMDILLEMDMVMGSLIKLLRERNLEDDTIIVFTSDNGGVGRKYSYKYGHNSHGPLKGAKGSINEGGHRVPLIMKWKNGNVPSGESRPKLVGLNDVYATLCELAGVEVPAGQAMDSISFANYLQNENEQSNLREYLGVWRFKGGRLFEESIRKNNLKLIRNPRKGSSSLYDLDSDISESNSLISHQSYASVVAEMIQKLEEISPCYDNQGSFFIQGTRRTCQWFAENLNRCNYHPQGNVECRLTCAGRSKTYCSMSPNSSLTPTYSPTVIPAIECKDSEDFTFGTFELNGNIRTCEWLANRPSAGRISDWCTRKVDGYWIKDYCQSTCGSCAIIECADSEDFTFGINKKTGIIRTCEWLTLRKEKLKSKWCNSNIEGYLVKDYCQSTCGVCS